MFDAFGYVLVLFYLYKRTKEIWGELYFHFWNSRLWYFLQEQRKEDIAPSCWESTCMQWFLNRISGFCTCLCCQRSYNCHWKALHCFEGTCYSASWCICLPIILSLCFNCILVWHAVFYVLSWSKVENIEFKQYYHAQAMEVAAACDGLGIKKLELALVRISWKIRAEKLLESSEKPTVQQIQHYLKEVCWGNAFS